MVEGDLVDLTLPSLLYVLARERSTAVLRLQRGTDSGALYFCEGTLVHARAGEATGDEAACDLLGWPDGRFRIARDAEPQPRTVTPRLATVVADAAPARAARRPAAAGDAGSGDEAILHDLLTLLTALEQDKARLEEAGGEAGMVAGLVALATVVNAMVAFVTGRCADTDVLPSRVLPRLSDEQPYTQMLGEDMDRISIATAAGVLKGWAGAPEERDQLYGELCRALVGVLTFYGNTAGTFFHGSREREEWRATFGVFVDGLSAAAQHVIAGAAAADPR
jgi:uncharacterized protein DUF4388